MRIITFVPCLVYLTFALSLDEWMMDSSAVGLTPSVRLKKQAGKMFFSGIPHILS